MNGAQDILVGRAKGNGKNNRRSLGFARDDTHPRGLDMTLGGFA